MSSQKPNSPPDDQAPDAWLKGALLHAPDAQADAPSALTHNILRESRLALELELDESARVKSLVAKPAPTRRSHWLIAVWNHLTRPAVAAGFASVMIAILSGVLWWDKPLDERGDPPMTTAAPSPQAAPAPASAAPLPSPAADASRAADSVALSLPSRRVVPEMGRDRDVWTSRAEALAKPAAESTARAELADAPRLQEPKPQAKRESTQADTVAAESVATAAAPAPAAVAPPSPVMPAQIAAPAAAVAAAPAPAPAPEVASAKVSRDDSAAFASPPQSRSAAMQSAPRAAPSAAPAPAPAPAPAATGNALTTQPASPFSSLLAAVTTSPELWRWQADGGEPQAVTPALQSWLRLLDQSAGSRWMAGNTTARAEDVSGAASITLFLTTGSGARIVLAGNTVTLQGGGAPWAVVLAPQAADGLRKAWADKLR